MNHQDTLEKIERLRELKRYQWFCPNPNCSGKPHAGFPHRHARAAQRLGDAYITFYCTGRGWGKTRSAAEIVKDRMLADDKHRVTVIAPTFGKGRDACIEGESGMLEITPPDRIANFNRSMGELVFKNGAQLKIFGSHNKEDAEAIRGSQSHTVWIEELAEHRHAQISWDNAMLANRLGSDPRVVVTATPKNTPLIRKLFNDPKVDRRGGSTFENEENLAATFVAYLREKYEGTRLGTQELEGLLLEDVVGALWTRDMFRFVPYSDATIEALQRIVIALDPPGSHRTRQSAEAGIVVVGKLDDFVYVLEDASQVATPEQWSSVAVELYDKYSADAIVAEKNFGGDMVTSTIRGAGYGAKVKLVTASRGKQLRAEPVVNLYERSKVVHCGSEDEHAQLVSQCCSWVPPGQTEVDENGVETPVEPSGYSPDRLDALVHGITELALQPKRSTTLMSCVRPNLRSY